MLYENILHRLRYRNRRVAWLVHGSAYLKRHTAWPAIDFLLIARLLDYLCVRLCGSISENRRSIVLTCMRASDVVSCISVLLYSRVFNRMIYIFMRVLLSLIPAIEFCCMHEAFQRKYIYTYGIC